jgi:hypothetical protein
MSTLCGKVAMPVGSVGNQAVINGLFYVWPSGPSAMFGRGSSNGGFASASTIVPRFYVKADGSYQALNSFGGVNTGAFFAPVLHLQFILRPGVIPPTKRAPISFKQLGAGVEVFTAEGETLVAAIPVYGRQTIRISMAATIANTVLRVGGLPSVQGTFDATNPPPVSALSRVLYAQEVTLGEKTAAAINERVSFCLSPANIDYLLLYATIPADGRVQWQVMASD